MKLSLLVSSKVLLTCCNFLLLGCGCILVTTGFLLLCDAERVLLSRLLVPGPLTVFEDLQQPLFYYLSLGVITLGLVLCFAGVMGCWSACIDNYCLLTTYFLLVMVVLLMECSIYSVVSIWPQCLGLTVIPPELARALQREYGVAGHEQFTVAVDLAQTRFNCCGISSSVEYDTSLWRLQTIGHPSLTVPLSCCRLENIRDISAYLDPKALNKTYCQALDIEHQQGYRHIEGCATQLEHWYQEQYLLFLAVGLVVVLIEFAVLLSTILSCVNVYKRRHLIKTIKRTVDANRRMDENTYQRSPFSYSNDAYSMTNSFRQNYKLTEKI